MKADRIEEGYMYKEICTWGTIIEVDSEWMEEKE